MRPSSNAFTIAIASAFGCVAVIGVLSFSKSSTAAAGQLNHVAHIGSHSASTSAQKSRKQVWIAASNTALSITGEIALTPDKLILAHKTFPLTLVKDIRKERLEDAAKIVNLSGLPASARLFKTLISRYSVLMNSNTICGRHADAKWILAVYGQGTLNLAFFSGANEPNLSYKSIEVSPHLCGTYTYISPGK